MLCYVMFVMLFYDENERERRKEEMRVKSLCVYVVKAMLSAVL